MLKWSILIVLIVLTVNPLSSLANHWKNRRSVNEDSSSDQSDEDITSSEEYNDQSYDDDYEVNNNEQYDAVLGEVYGLMKKFEKQSEKYRKYWENILGSKTIDELQKGFERAVKERPADIYRMLVQIANRFDGGDNSVEHFMDPESGSD